jgi:hypothetical protein
MIRGHKKIIYRKKEKKSFFKKRFFWDLILFFIFISSLAWLLFKTPYFEIKEIKILSSPNFVDKIKEISSKEKNFFLFSSQTVSQEIKKSFPEIKEVKIKKNFPNNILIETENRKEIGIFCCGDNISTCFLLAEDGVIFAKTENKGGLIVFSKPEEKTVPKPGDSIIEKEKFSEILFFLKEVRNVDIIINRVEIFPFEIRAFTPTNFKIYLSNNSDIKKQTASLINVYKNTISNQEKQTLEYIDLRGLENGEKGEVYWK